MDNFFVPVNELHHRRNVGFGLLLTQKKAFLRFVQGEGQNK